jgi:Rrf2 family protein
MKLLTRNTDYAIRALCRMAEDREELFSAADLVKELNIPRPFMRKLLQELHKHKLLKSYRGRIGGFKLSLPPEEIYIYRIAEIFQGKIVLNEHIFRGKPCPRQKNCNLKAKLDEIESKVISELKTISIASIMD